MQGQSDIESNMEEEAKEQADMAEEEGEIEQPAHPQNTEILRERDNIQAENGVEAMEEEKQEQGMEREPLGAEEEAESEEHDEGEISEEESAQQQRQENELEQQKQQPQEQRDHQQHEQEEEPKPQEIQPVEANPEQQPEIGTMLQNEVQPDLQQPVVQNYQVHQVEQQNESVQVQPEVAQAQVPSEQSPIPQASLDEPRQSIQNEKTKQYIHKLEKQLICSNQQILFLKNALESLNSGHSSLRAQLQSNRQSSMDLRRKKLQVELERTKLSKEVQRYKKQNQIQKKKLEQVQQVGDIFILKATLQELKLLTDVQTKQIDQLKSVNEQLRNNTSLNEEIEIIKKYQEQTTINLKTIEQLTKINKELAHQLDTSKYNNTEISETLQQTKKETERLSLQTTELKQIIIDWQNKWRQFQTERQTNRKARELEESIMHFQSEKNVKTQQWTNFNILSDKEEKKLLLRQYLILESKNTELTYDLEEATTKLRKLEREQLKIHANFIKKKQYLDLSAKYGKAKKCLEGAFQELRKFKRSESLQSVGEEVNELLEGVEARECQNLIKTTNQIVANLHEQVAQLEQKSIANDLQLQLTQQQSTILSLKTQLSSNSKLLALMNNDIILKNKLIKQKNQIIDGLRRKQILETDSTKLNENIIQMENEITRLKQVVAVHETQNIILAREITALNGQVAHWKQLYEEIKNNLTQRIITNLQIKDIPKEHSHMEEEPPYLCRQCELRKLSLLSTKELQSQQSQTDNLYEYYYREIKQYLNNLKRTSKQYDAIPTYAKDMIKVINQIKERFLIEFKEKFQKIQTVYKNKMEEVKKQKMDNDNWRNRTKEDIREEFQDIRELVINNRLLNALRQAKNLIDYLENQVQKQEEDNQAQEEKEEREEREEKEEKEEIEEEQEAEEEGRIQ